MRLALACLALTACDSDRPASPADERRQYSESARSDADAEAPPFETLPEDNATANAQGPGR